MRYFESDTGRNKLRTFRMKSGGILAVTRYYLEEGKYCWRAHYERTLPEEHMDAIDTDNPVASGDILLKFMGKIRLSRARLDPRFRGVHERVVPGSKQRTLSEAIEDAGREIIKAQDSRLMSALLGIADATGITAKACKSISDAIKDAAKEMEKLK